MFRSFSKFVTILDDAYVRLCMCGFREEQNTVTAMTKNEVNVVCEAAGCCRNFLLRLAKRLRSAFCYGPPRKPRRRR